MVVMFPLPNSFVRSYALTMNDRYESGSKRASDGMDYDEERQIKRPRSDLHVDVRMLLAAKVAGAIIGKNGENIKRLRRDNKASLSVPDSRGTERIMTISANVDVVCDIMMDIIPRISKQMNRSEEEDHEVRLLIHQSHAGRVIGKGGNRIKELREESGCQVKLYMDCAPFSSDRVVQITGSMRQIIKCLEGVFETLEGVQPKGANLPYNPNKCDGLKAHSYGGYTDERGGQRAGQKGGRKGRGAVGVNGRDGAAFGTMPSFMRDSRGGGATIDKVTTSQVSIPKALAGAILGTGGSHIKQVQQESGTKIKLEEAPPASAERVISITGTQEQIQYAQYLFRVTVKRQARA